MDLIVIYCYIAGVFPSTAHVPMATLGHIISNNKTVFRQKFLAGNIAKSMTSECNSALLTGEC